MIKRELFQLGRSKGIPISGTFELTRRCNLNCRMCYIHETSSEEGDHELSFSEDLEGHCKKQDQEFSADAWIYIGKQAVRRGMLYLLLTGGEPFIRKDFPYIYEQLVKLGLHITINTNGLLLTDRIFQLLCTYPPEQVNITVYGSSDQTYEELCGCVHGYERVTKNIRILKNAGIPLAINTTFTRWNRNDMEEIVAFAGQEKLPVRTSNFLFSSKAEDEKDLLTSREAGELIFQFERLTMKEVYFQKRCEIIKAIDEQKIPEDIRPRRCMAGCGAFWISWDGQMYPCGMVRDGADVLSLGFDRAWEETKVNAGQFSWPKECTYCVKKKICPFCQAVYESLGRDMTKVKGHMCVQVESYMDMYRRELKVRDK